MKLSLFYSLALCLLLSACGMKGPLVLPEKIAADKPAATATAAPATTENQEKPAKPVP